MCKSAHSIAGVRGPYITPPPPPAASSNIAPTLSGMQRPGSASCSAACARQPVQCPAATSAGDSSARSRAVGAMRDRQSRGAR